jgi:hypothetical protein
MFNLSSLRSKLAAKQRSAGRSQGREIVKGQAAADSWQQQ